ncbi:MAG: hypothetical protein ACJAVI_002303 [Candidatus Azotimanducaceae bacterium]|jgi:hypothetical protein
MRYHDGPMEIITGGPFQSGSLVVENEGSKLDINSLIDRDTFEFQLLDPPRSRTVWLAVNDNRLFIASAYMNEGYAKIWKQWPHQVAENNKILLRIDEQIYERQLIRTFDDDIANAVGKETERKYGAKFTHQDVASEGVWIYEVSLR